MAYSELIKNFSKIREYMRQFYVYGFRSRSEFDIKSARGYDNERRRVESWLSEYMRFRQEETGKIVYMSIDSRNICRNPLYKAFKTKSFTDNDITFHFYLLDILSSGEEYSAYEILDWIGEEYISNFENHKVFDESNVRKKLKEYVKLGILNERKAGREVLFSLNESQVNLESWSDAVAFFSEENPLGVIGSYIEDRNESSSGAFRFKHSYMFSAIDSQVVYELLGAISEEKDVDVVIRRKDKAFENSLLCPLKIYISTQNGRQYLLGYQKKKDRFSFVRIDNIESLEIRDKNENRQEYLKESQKLQNHLWGVALGTGETLDRVEMTIHIEDDEEFVYNRILREKRCGEVVRKDKNTCVFTADVYDARELIPWIRTFFGRIEDFYCSSDYVVQTLNSDLQRLAEFYGGDEDAVQ